MAERIDDISIEYVEPTSGKQLVKQLDKQVLTRGAWSTIVFRYRDLDQRADEYGPVKYRIGRYRKRGGEFLPQSKFNISSAEQARQLIEILQRWLEQDAGTANEADRE